MTKTLLDRITDTARAALIDLATLVPSGFQNGKPLERQPPLMTYATTHFGPPAERIDADAETFLTLKQQYEQGYIVLSANAEAESRRQWEEILAQLKQDISDRSNPFRDFIFKPYLSYDTTSRERETFPLLFTPSTPYLGGGSSGHPGTGNH